MPPQAAPMPARDQVASLRRRASACRAGWWIRANIACGVAAGLGGLGLFMYLFAAMGEAWRWGIGVQVAAVAIACSLAVAGASWLFFSLRRDLIRDRLEAKGLARHECPVCAYPLSGLPDGGGGIVCPECGHACEAQAAP
jgi:hypothetical protein